ncbi:patatin-like phospholipase family protein [soil metagenome]
MDPVSWRGVAFEGGGVAGLGHVGVIKSLESNKILPQITHVTGSSAGSIISTLVACRLPYEKIKEIILDLDFTSFEDSSWFVVSDIYRLVNNFGWNTGDAITKIFGDILETHIGNRSITFDQILEKYGTTLIITTTDVCPEKTVYYSPLTHPNMPVVESARNSSGIPFFYCPVIKDGHMYVDGGLLDNYPIEKLYEFLPKEQVFGVKLISNPSSTSDDKIPSNIIEYASKIIKILHHQAAKVHINSDDWKRTIKVDVGSISTIDFNLDKDQKLWLISQGEAACNKFFGF